MKRIILEYGPNSKVPSKADKRILSLIVRTKSYGMEVDITTGDLDNLLLELKNRYEPNSYRIIREMEPLVAPDMKTVILALKDSIELFREERYWESHISLEMVWRNSEGEVRKFLQGIITIAASQVQFQMGNASVATSQYEKAAQMLKGSAISRKFKLDIPESFVYPVRLVLDL